MSFQKHKEVSIANVRVGIISVSTTRNIENDESGKWIIQQFRQRNHAVLVYKLIKDNKNKIREGILESINENDLDIVLVTGGTGITERDVTIEAITPIFSKILHGFVSIFAQLSYREIGSAAIMSRASAGIIGRTAVFCIPGSRDACKLACEALIFPEIEHIVSHVKN